MGLPFSIQSRDNTLLIGDQWFEVDFHLIMNNVRKQWYYNWILFVIGVQFITSHEPLK